MRCKKQVFIGIVQIVVIGKIKFEVFGFWEMLNERHCVIL
jgi:hypothetical protein